MIKANELRIGNWVGGTSNTEKYPMLLKVVGIAEQVQLLAAENKSGESITFDWEYGLIHPIPLSPELLEKCGFKSDMIENPCFSGYSIDINHRREIAVSNPGTPNEMVFLNEIEDSGERKVIVIKNFDYDGKTFLHTLMNIIHALTGSEIEVNL